ncbi:MAG: NFACT family protein [Thermoplasmata archaeon]|nr:NFACT family protein [Thermoplasmata archaeon]
MVPRPPKDRFTSLDALALARELRAMESPHVDKAFDYGEHGWVLALRSRRERRRDLVIQPGSFGALALESVEHGESPRPFARELRRLLAGSVVVGVAEPGGDRILDMEFARTDGAGSVRMIVEFFGSGNVVLVRDGKIVAVAHPKTWAHRVLRVGEMFVPPPATADPWTSSSGQIEVLLLGSRTDRVSTLAARGGFSGPVAEELLIRAGETADRPAPEKAGEVASAVVRAASELREEMGPDPAGYLYHRGDELVDVTPFPSHRRRQDPELRESRVDSFGAAVLQFFQSRPLPVAPSPTPKSSVAEGLQRQRTQQVEAVDRLEKEAGLKVAQANRIFEQYPDAEAARARASTESGGKTSVNVRLGDLEVPISPDRPIEHSARDLYEEAKRAKVKLAGAREALAATESRITEVHEATPEPLRTAPSVGATGKPQWFEKFRWFYSSEGILVVAGRDAGSNDTVVRRYLRAGDRYIHADIHGAASVVVKVSGTPGAPVPGAATLEEAGQFAVAFSKAWRAELAGADAFWVLPEQVSKTGASGEFVARGAWVIHGTKNPLKDLPTELAIGTLEREGRTYWTVAPPRALRIRGTILATLRPGPERERAGREVELSKALGVSRSVLQPLLPAGGLSVILA